LILHEVKSKDTTYLASQIETPQTKAVLIEELTGASCTNCPKGSKMLKDFQVQYPGKVIVTAIHSGFLTDPPPGAKNYFPNADADALRLFFDEGDPAKPSATFDRTKASSGNSMGKYFVIRGQTGTDWNTALQERLPITTPVNLTLSVVNEVGANKYKVTSTIHFTEAVSDKLALTIYLLEDGIIDKQEDKDLGTIDNYEFNHVFRKLITNVAGAPVLDSLATKEKGRVLKKIIDFEVDATKWNINNCHLVGLVHKTGASREVLQAVTVKLN
jgi:hypothetical protein